MGKYDKEFNELKLLADSIWEKAKKLLGERAEYDLFKGSNIFKLTSQEGHYVILEITDCDHVVLTFYDRDDNKLFFAETAREYIIRESENGFALKYISSFKPLEIMDYINIFKKLEFDKIKLLYSYNRIHAIRQLIEKTFGIEEDELSVSDSSYLCITPKITEMLSAVINGRYHVTSSIHNGEYFENIIDGNNIHESFRVNKSDIVETFDLEIDLGYEEKLRIRKYEKDYMFFYKKGDFGREIKVSFEDERSSLMLNELKSIALYDWDNMNKWPKIKIDYSHNKLVDNEKKKLYSISIYGRKEIDLIEQKGIEHILNYPEVRDFIIFIINIIENKLTKEMKEYILDYRYFGNVTKHVYKNENFSDDKIKDIFNKIKETYHKGGNRTSDLIIEKIESILKSKISESEKTAKIESLCRDMSSSTIDEVSSYINCNEAGKKLELKLK